ncbi:hypothetical protein [Jatrophihabitans endophyticus]|uniref:hypothetical protein n=1 Tax=Jatrophihabitans endophyticus TaxID=1206085 RepID=UPI0019FA817C|nr:hypothetical protein [Jatrophihabitans endophyticus]MBE7189262.1 hypothetical protein [Jatrophihabitans endophyticus]
MPLAISQTVALTLWVVLGLVVLAVVFALIGRWLYQRGLHEPFVVRFVNSVSDRVIESVKRPITIAVLDEVADVLQTGNYTRNLAAALEENRTEIQQMVTEKIKQDPTAGAINYLPFHDRLISEVIETTLRVVFEVLADPRTDELVSDLLRDNITQIRRAVREQG